MLVVGVTGMFGAGKTTVAKMFGKCGARVIEADHVAHDLLRGRTPVTQKVKKMFGSRILSSGRIDRMKLGEVVFNDPKRLKGLEDVLHPLVRKKIRETIRVTKRRCVVIDAALLIEAGWKDMADKVVVVRASLPHQVERVRKRAGLTRADVLKRIRRQMPLREKLSFADFIVDNRGDLADTYRQVGEIYKKLFEN